MIAGRDVAGRVFSRDAGATERPERPAPRGGATTRERDGVAARPGPPRARERRLAASAGRVDDGEGPLRRMGVDKRLHMLAAAAAAGANAEVIGQRIQAPAAFLEGSLNLGVPHGLTETNVHSETECK